MMMVMMVTPVADDDDDAGDDDDDDDEQLLMRSCHQGQGPARSEARLRRCHGASEEAEAGTKAGSQTRLPQLERNGRHGAKARSPTRPERSAAVPPLVMALPPAFIAFMGAMVEMCCGMVLLRRCPKIAFPAKQRHHCLC